MPGWLIISLVLGALGWIGVALWLATRLSGWMPVVLFALAAIFALVSLFNRIQVHPAK